MFDSLYRVAKCAADVATVPVSIAADAVTFGGLLTDRDETYTESKAKRIAKDSKDILDDIAG